jgi:hypothetical protein
LANEIRLGQVPLDAVEDLIGRLRPHERLGIVIVSFQKLANVLLKRAGTSVDAAARDIAFDDRKEGLDEI